MVLRDVALAQVICQHSAKVVQAGLAGTVGKGLKRGHAKTVNTPDVDDACRVIRSRGLLQEWSHELGEIEDTVQIECEDASEGFGGVFIVRSAPIRA